MAGLPAPPAETISNAVGRSVRAASSPRESAIPKNCSPRKSRWRPFSWRTASISLPPNRP
jgi:hypothetical protein